MKVLIIEDDNSLREIIEKILLQEHFIVETANNCAQGLDKIEVYNYDCIIIDIMLPDGNGLDILRKLKSLNRNEGVIILSARDSIDDKVDGLELGADDYMSKPFHASELLARIKSIIRRKQGNGQSIISYGNMTIDTNSFIIKISNSVIELSLKEYNIIYYLIINKGRVVTKESLVEAVWGDNVDQNDNYDFIYTHIKNIRRKLMSAGSTIEVKSIYGLGYKAEEA